MRAVRSTPPRVTVIDLGVPDEGGELVAIRSASICASDFKYIAWGSTKILGYELAGITQDGTPVGIETMFGCDGLSLPLAQASMAPGVGLSAAPNAKAGDPGGLTLTGFEGEHTGSFCVGLGPEGAAAECLSAVRSAITAAKNPTG